VSHDHYKKDVSHLKFIDPYRVADLYGMDGGPIEHAFKKVLCAGMRGHKSRERDVQDAIDSLLRWQEMQREDAARNVGEFGQKNMLMVSAPVEWPTPEQEKRQEVINQNGNDGEHYAVEISDHLTVQELSKLSAKCSECMAEHCACVAA
jgi:hypothetical protein